MVEGILKKTEADDFETSLKEVQHMKDPKQKLEGYVVCFERNREVIVTAFSSMKSVYEYCTLKGVFSDRTKTDFEQSIADFKGSIKMSKDLFICINTSFIDSCITYYSNDAVTSNMKAIQAVSQQNQVKTHQIKEAFEKVHQDILKTSDKFDKLSAAMFDDFQVYQERLKAELDQIKTKVDAATAEIDAAAQKISNLEATQAALTASAAIPYVGVLATIANIVLVAFVAKAKQELANSQGKLKEAQKEHNSKKEALEKDIPQLSKAIESLSQSLKVAASLCHLIASIYQIQEDFAQKISLKIGEIVNVDLSMGEEVAKLLANVQFNSVVDDLKEFKISNERCISLYQDVLSLAYVDITAKPAVAPVYLEYAKMNIVP